MIDDDDILPIENALLSNLASALEKGERVDAARDALKRFYSTIGMY